MRAKKKNGTSKARPAVAYTPTVVVIPSLTLPTLQGRRKVLGKQRHRPADPLDRHPYAKGHEQPAHSAVQLQPLSRRDQRFLNV